MNLDILFSVLCFHVSYSIHVLKSSIFFRIRSSFFPSLCFILFLLCMFGFCIGFPPSLPSLSIWMDPFSPPWYFQVVEGAHPALLFHSSPACKSKSHIYHHNYVLPFLPSKAEITSPTRPSLYRTLLSPSLLLSLLDVFRKLLLVSPSASYV